MIIGLMLASFSPRWCSPVPKENTIFNFIYPGYFVRYRVGFVNGNHFNFEIFPGYPILLSLLVDQELRELSALIKDLCPYLSIMSFICTQMFVLSEEVVSYSSRPR